MTHICGGGCPWRNSEENQSRRKNTLITPPKYYFVPHRYVLYPFCYLVAMSCLILCNLMDCSQAPLSMGFPRQESWTGLPFPSPGNLSNSGIKPMSPALSCRFFTLSPLGSHLISYLLVNVCSRF